MMLQSYGKTAYSVVGKGTGVARGGVPETIKQNWLLKAATKL